MCTTKLFSLVFLVCCFITSSAFSPNTYKSFGGTFSLKSPLISCRSLSNGNKELETSSSSSSSSSSYENSDASSKGIVSSLTNVVNFFMGDNSENDKEGKEYINDLPPASPNELLEKIKEDYIINNYLWTGDIYTPAFEKECRFTDPTLSFTGTDQFVSNVQNLRPILDLLMEPNQCKSDLLDISLNEEEGYVQSRWNMVGKLGRLPWKPKIDVIGRTKFWYQSTGKDQRSGEEKGVKVYFYDEEWEIPAGKALLQLITPDSSQTI